MPKSTAPTRYGTGTLIAAASICLFLVTWAYFFVQVRQERAAREAQAHTSPVTAPGTPDLVILQQADPANDLSVPVAPYYAALIKGQEQDGVDSGYVFPLTADPLQPGVLHTENLQVFNPDWMTETVAVVGDDDASKKWLNFHLPRLQSLKTTVVVVSAKTEQSFKEVQKLVQNLAIVPDEGQWVQRKLVAAGANAYPLFIGTDGKARQHIFKDGLIVRGAL